MTQCAPEWWKNAASVCPYGTTILFGHITVKYVFVPGYPGLSAVIVFLADLYSLVPWLVPVYCILKIIYAASVSWTWEEIGLQSSAIDNPEGPLNVVTPSSGGGLRAAMTRAKTKLLLLMKKTIDALLRHIYIKYPMTVAMLTVSLLSAIRFVGKPITEACVVSMVMVSIPLAMPINCLKLKLPTDRKVFHWNNGQTTYHVDRFLPIYKDKGVSDNFAEDGGLSRKMSRTMSTTMMRWRRRQELFKFGDKDDEATHNFEGPMGLDLDENCFVTKVEDGGQAQKKEIKVGSRIVKVHAAGDGAERKEKDVKLDEDGVHAIKENLALHLKEVTFKVNYHWIVPEGVDTSKGIPYVRKVALADGNSEDVLDDEKQEVFRGKEILGIPCDEEGNPCAKGCKLIKVASQEYIRDIRKVEKNRDRWSDDLEKHSPQAVKMEAWKTKENSWRIRLMFEAIKVIGLVGASVLLKWLLYWLLYPVDLLLDRDPGQRWLFLSAQRPNLSCVLGCAMPSGRSIVAMSVLTHLLIYFGCQHAAHNLQLKKKCTGKQQGTYTKEEMSKLGYVPISAAAFYKRSLIAISVFLPVPFSVLVLYDATPEQAFVGCIAGICLAICYHTVCTVFLLGRHWRTIFGLEPPTTATSSARCCRDKSHLGAADWIRDRMVRFCARPLTTITRGVILFVILLRGIFSLVMAVIGMANDFGTIREMFREEAYYSALWFVIVKLLALLALYALNVFVLYFELRELRNSTSAQQVTRSRLSTSNDGSSELGQPSEGILELGQSSEGIATRSSAMTDAQRGTADLRQPLQGNAERRQSTQGETQRGEEELRSFDEWQRNHKKTLWLVYLLSGYSPSVINVAFLKLPDDKFLRRLGGLKDFTQAPGAPRSYTLIFSSIVGKSVRYFLQYKLGGVKTMVDASDAASSDVGATAGNTQAIFGVIVGIILGSVALLQIGWECVLALLVRIDGKSAEKKKDTDEDKYVDDPEDADEWPLEENQEIAGGEATYLGYEFMSCKTEDEVAVLKGELTEDAKIFKTKFEETFEKRKKMEEKVRYCTKVEEIQHHLEEAGELSNFQFIIGKLFGGLDHKKYSAVVKGVQDLKELEDSEISEKELNGNLYVNSEGEEILLKVEKGKLAFSYNDEEKTGTLTGRTLKVDGWDNEGRVFSYNRIDFKNGDQWTKKEARCLREDCLTEFLPGAEFCYNCGAQRPTDIESKKARDKAKEKAAQDKDWIKRFKSGSEGIKKQMIGELTYKIVDEYHEERAGKITGMVLECGVLHKETIERFESLGPDAINKEFIKKKADEMAQVLDGKKTEVRMERPSSAESDGKCAVQ